VNKQMKNSFFSRFFIFLLVEIAMLLSLQSLQAEGIETGQTISATGKGFSKDIALQNALRNAVEQGVGTIIGSETLVRNGILIKDKVLAKTTGYVRRYTILQERKTPEGEWEIKILANVNSEKIENDIVAIALLIDWLNYPRIMLLINEMVDGKPSSSWIATTSIEQVFLGKGLELIDATQARQNYKDRLAEFSKNPSKVAVLAKGYGAEIVIVGEARSSFYETSYLYGMRTHFYNAILNLKAVRTADAKILASTNTTATWGSPSKQDASYKALRRAATQIAGKLLGQIMVAWRGQVYEQQEFKLVVHNVDAPTLSKIRSELKRNRNVKRVIESGFDLKIKMGILRVKFLGKSETLKEILMGMKSPYLTILSTGNRKIEVEVKKKFW